MKRIGVTGASLVVTLIVGIALAPASYANLSNSVIDGPLVSAPFPQPVATSPAPYVSPRLALEIASLASEGIPPARATLAIGVQSTIAQSDLVNRIETALGSAFAGVWFEAATAQLHVGVTSQASRRKVKVIAAGSGLTSHVTETPVRSTWAQLLAAENEWSLRLASHMAAGKAQIGLTPQQNAVSVTLSSSIPALERARLERESTEAVVSVIVNVVRPSQLALEPMAKSTACNPFSKSAAYCDKPITAGVTIIGNATGQCTAGPFAVPTNSGKNVILLLTAGHCISSTGGRGVSWESRNRNGSKGLIGRSSEFAYATKGDYGAILIEPGFWTEPDTKNPVFAVMAEWGTKDPTKSYPVDGERAPMVGATSCHEGQTSGESCGIVSKTSKTFIVGSVTVAGLVEVTGPKLVIEEGDSGGPCFFVTSSNELLIEGTVSGGGAGLAAYEPIATILTNLSLLLLTSKNEVRP